ncbi:hypothetical protein BKI52_12260 [marine bacterium AO1-C]|nr:hypothetical protein BKI52_12260 [marine bacterium AO1-C]
MESKFFVITEYISTVDDFILALLLFVILNAVTWWAFHSWTKFILSIRQRKLKHFIFYGWLSFLLGAMSLPWYTFILPPAMLIILVVIGLVLISYRSFHKPLSVAPTNLRNATPPSLNTYSYAPPVPPQPMPQTMVPVTTLAILEKKANTLWKNYEPGNESSFWKKYEQLLDKMNRLA